MILNSVLCILAGWGIFVWSSKGRKLILYWGVINLLGALSQALSETPKRPDLLAAIFIAYILFWLMLPAVRRRFELQQVRG